MLSPDDRELIARDRLPGLGCALDPDALLALLRQRVPSWDSAPVRITYVRYKPGTSILVGCEAESPAGTLRVTVCGYPSSHDDKFRLHERLREVRSPIGPAQMLIDDLALTLTFFPADRDIHAAGQLASPSTWQSLADDLALPADSTWEMLRYKPERRLALRVTTPRGPCVLKLYATDQYARAVAANEAITSANARLPRVLAASPERQAAVYSWVPGAQLDTRFASPSTLRGVAVELAAIHVASAPSLPLRSRADDARAILELSEWLAFVAPTVAADAERLGRDLAGRISAAPQEHLPIHGDFYSTQVIIAGGDVRIIDFDEACLGDPLADLATFAAHLDPSESATAERLADEYADVTGTRIDTERFAVECAAALYKLAAVPFRERSPRWAEEIATILQRSARCLGGSAARTSANALREPLDPAIVTADLSRALGTRTVVRSARLLRRREGRRALIEYELECNGDAPAMLVGKLHDKGLDGQTFELNRRLRQLGFDETSDVALPEAVAALPRLRMWLQRRIDGELATEVLGRAGNAPFARRIAAALNRLHGSGLHVEREHTVHDELRILREALKHAASARPDLAERTQRLATLAERTAAAIPAVPPRLIHRDFYSDHVIFSGATTYLIDFDLASMGDPALDAGNFVAHLIEQGIRSPETAEALRAAAAVFIDHYSRMTGAGVGERIEAWTALALARHVHISTRIGERRAFTDSIAATAERHLERQIEQETLP